MNSSQRRKAKKAKHLINLGRQAEEVINHAEAQVQHWQGAAAAAAKETERVKGTLDTTASQMHAAMAQATTFEEAVKAAQDQCTKQLAEQRGVHLIMLAEQSAEHVRAMAAAGVTHQANLARLEAQARAAGGDAAATIRHLRSELIEPTKLRKRLHRKEVENEQLRLENNQFRQKLGLPTVEPLVHETDLDLHEELVAGAAT